MAGSPAAEWEGVRIAAQSRSIGGWASRAVVTPLAVSMHARSIADCAPAAGGGLVGRGAWVGKNPAARSPNVSTPAGTAAGPSCASVGIVVVPVDHGGRIENSPVMMHSA